MLKPKSASYRELYIAASDLVSFMQSIYSQGRVGTLTVSFGTGGVPCGMLVWRERIIESTDFEAVSDSKSFPLHSSPLP